MAGTSMKDIKLRIRSVESTRQITKAMQLVATSKLRRAKERMENSKPYATVSREAVMAAVRSCAQQDTPFVAAHPDGRRCYVIIAGERGLAGGYNSNVFKAVAAFPPACCPLAARQLKSITARARSCCPAIIPAWRGWASAAATSWRTT